MIVTASELTRHLGGQLVGSPNTAITGLAPPESATESEAAVVFDANAPLPASRAALLVVARGVIVETDRAVVRVDEPRVALATLTALFACPMTEGEGVHHTAVIASDATIDPSAYVGPLCVVESGAAIGAGARLVAHVYVGRGVVVGSHSRIMPGATLYPGTRLGNRVIIQAGARIGCDGFGYVTEAPDHPKVHSLGGVQFGDDVEIGANTTIERATFGDSLVGRGTKIGDACVIGHNIEFGDHCLLVGHIAIAGSVHIGNRVQLAMGVLVRDHVTIGDDSLIMMGSHVVRDVPPGSRMLGAPAIPENEHKARVRALAQMRQRVLDEPDSSP